MRGSLLHLVVKERADDSDDESSTRKKKKDRDEKVQDIVDDLMSKHGSKYTILQLRIILY